MTYGRGRLNGIHPPIGTVMGPNAYGELLAVDTVDDAGCTLRLATQHDVDAAMAHEPQSRTEHRLQRRARKAGA